MGKLKSSPPARRSSAVRTALLWLLVLGCQRLDWGGDERLRVPAWGKAETLDVGSWNVTWFGSPTQGPRDDRAQRRRVRDVLAGSDLDLWALTEVVDESAFISLLDDLPGYAGLLASDARVRQGSRFYAPAEQKPGLVFKTHVWSVVDAEVILTDHDAEFAGRPPLRVALRAGSVTWQVIVLHAKAFSDAKSYARRAAASQALQVYLDRELAGARRVVLGDFNDEIFESISPGRPSPYANFVQADARYRFVTAELAQRQLSSTVNRGGLIDHHLISRELYASFVPGSTQLLPIDRYVPDYAETTSDHYPVASRFRAASE